MELQTARALAVRFAVVEECAGSFSLSPGETAAVREHPVSFDAFDNRVAAVLYSRLTPLPASFGCCLLQCQRWTQVPHSAFPEAMVVWKSVEVEQDWLPIQFEVAPQREDLSSLARPDDVEVRRADGPLEQENVGAAAWGR